MIAANVSAPEYSTTPAQPQFFSGANVLPTSHTPPAPAKRTARTGSQQPMRIRVGFMGTGLQPLAAARVGSLRPRYFVQQGHDFGLCEVRHYPGPGSRVQS